MVTTMTNKFYIARVLFDEKRTYTESDLLASSSHIVVLAEPGAGKTDLLSNLASTLQTERVSATRFRYLPPTTTCRVLVIDAFDEVSRIDQTGVFEILAKAQATGADKVIISSRSSEWDSTSTHHFSEFFGQHPKIVRLTAFNLEEQKQLFENQLPDETFYQFRSEVARFELDPLLANPIFLKLFADAYIESERHFSDKNSIFEKAIDHLAKEVNSGISQRAVTSIEKKIEFANEAFAKLLLSGSEGVSLTDANADRLYPRLASLISDGSSPDCILDTRLFKPADRQAQHLPVHKIVAEFCAARYLTSRILNSSDNLSLPQCLAIIAPNSTIRDELRGMLGWMAALGNETIQKTAITLDPYAVLANGDPSQLLPSSKRLLIQKLTEAAKENPLFRRGDVWRTFSASGFFTQDVVDQLKPLLSNPNQPGDLLGLLLELLAGSPAILHLVDELRQLLLDPENDYYIRLLASNCLVEIQECNHQSDVLMLISEASETSLKIAANIIDKVGAESFELPFILDFLRACFPLYPDKKTFERTIGERYFIKKLISTLKLSTVEWLLNELTCSLSCVCNKPDYECECRNGVSKVAGILLDSYFDLLGPPYEPSKIWQWLKKLNFHNEPTTSRSRSVQELQQNDELRQGIIQIAFKDKTDLDEIIELQIEFFNGSNYHHSGLCFREQDYRFIIDFAFDAENSALWSRFLAVHHNPPNKEIRGVNILRKHMREQAKLKPRFMREWALKNRNIQKYQYKIRKQAFPYTRRGKKREKEQDKIRAGNIKYVSENRELVESGRHWTCLSRFAYLVLDKPEQIEPEFGDISLVKNALMNCFDFIEPEIPSLQNMAELWCESKSINVEIILIAACFVTLRETGHLESVKPHILAAARTRTSSHFRAIDTVEQDALMAEIDRLLFPILEDAEEFVRGYIEPQLTIKGFKHPQVSWLKSYSALKPLQKKLPLEWLHRFLDIEINTQNELFEMAAQYGDREEVEKLIIQRCAELMPSSLNQYDKNEASQSRIFWLVRAFYFLPEMPADHWKWLSRDKNTVLAFSNYSGRLTSHDCDYRPNLSSRKIELILDAFIQSWPEPKAQSNSGWVSHRPASEIAYQFLSAIIWNLGEDDPDNSLPILNRLIADSRFTVFEASFRSIRATAIRAKALRNFEAPSPQKIVSLLDDNEVVTVEGLRALLLQELMDYQADLDGSETTSKDIFYEKGERLGEVPATLRIADRMRLRLEGNGITVTPEHQLKDANRSDFTFSKVIRGQRRLLVAEVKGQWHRELYSAASKQLFERYSIHPDAENQGIYLILWFGKDEKIAGRKNTKIRDAETLKKSIEGTIPDDLKGRIDVFVLDLSL